MKYLEHLVFPIRISAAPPPPPPPPDLFRARHIKSVDGFVFFRLSYFYYCDLQLFANFMI